MKKFRTLKEMLDELGIGPDSKTCFIVRQGTYELYVSRKFLTDGCAKLLNRAVIGVGNSENIYYGPAMVFMLANEEESQ